MLPKVELHRHLEGALRFSTVLELAKSSKKDLPYRTFEDAKDQLLVRAPMKDLKSVLDKFWFTQSLLDSEEVLDRITFEAVEDAYNDGIKVLELRYSLSFIKTNHPLLNYEKIHQGIYKGLQRARTRFPVATGLIGILGRNDPPDVQKRAMDFMIDARKEFIGVDLADNEIAVDTKSLAPLFEKAKKAGLHVTIHAGESPGTHENVRESIEWLGAERIGHGVQIYGHDDIIEFVKKHDVALELCPISNWLTNAVPETRKHPFRKLMAQGLKVTINSDDPGIFDTSLSRDYEILIQEHEFTPAELKICADVGARSSFIPKSEIEKVWSFG
jgi:adenosine deaminase